MKKVLKALYNIFACLVGADCEWRRQAVEDGALDFGGQGRNQYGR